MKTVFRAFSEEFQALIHSIAGLTVLVMGVIFYSLLYPQPYLHQVPQKLPLLVVDRDRTTTSRTLLRLMDSTEGARVAAVYSDAPSALADLRDGKGQAALIIPDDFERNVLRGAPTVLPIYLDAGYLLPYRVLYRGIKLAAENMGAGVRVQQFQARGMPEKPALALQLRGQFDVRTLYNPAGNYAQSTIPAVFVLILQQTLLIGGAILAERLYRPDPDDRSLKDASSGRYLFGRLLFLTCLYVVYAVYYTWLLPVVYDLPRAHATGDVLLFLLPFFLACGAAGTAFARVVGRPEYVLMAALPCSMPFLFLSGFVWPPEAMPAAVRALAQILPSTPAINGYLLLSQRGAVLSDILPLWGQLWGLALFFFGLAWLLIKLRATHGTSPHTKHEEHGETGSRT